jgi:N-acetylneuraminic acid mutarotase
MLEPRARHELVALSDGSFLVVGGVTIESDGAVVLAREILRYVPGTDTWEVFENLPLRAASLVAERVGDRLYVIGGVTGPMAVPETPPAPARTRDDVQILDLTTMTWSVGAPKITPEGGVTSAVLGDDIYVVSSYDDFGRINALVEVYDTATDTWTAAPDMPTARTDVPAAFLGGKLFTVNGLGRGSQALSLIEVYDPQTDQWTTLSHAPPASYSSGYVRVDDSTMVIFGGRARPDYSGASFNPEWNSACADCDSRLEALYDESSDLSHLAITSSC